MPEMYAELSTWWRAHEQDPPPPQRLPVNGFVVPGVAAVFFFVTDTESAILEYAVTNRTASFRQRFAAIRAISEACMRRAYELGYRHMMLLTPFSGLARIAQRAGARIERRGASYFCERSLNDGCTGKRAQAAE